jgi:hypothetical protein
VKNPNRQGKGILLAEYFPFIFVNLAAKLRYFRQKAITLLTNIAFKVFLKTEQ